MNTTVKALQGLYVKLGGSLTDTYDTIDGGAAVGDYTTIPDCIAACTELANESPKLPKVTTTDNGKILTVVAGEWAAVLPTP